MSEAYKALFSGSVINFSAYTVADALKPFTETLYTSTSLIFAGLAVALPFRAGLFNIGAQGQLIMGAIVAGYVGFSVLDAVPAPPDRRHPRRPPRRRASGAASRACSSPRPGPTR